MLLNISNAANYRMTTFKTATDNDLIFKLLSNDANNSSVATANEPELIITHSFIKKKHLPC